MRNDLDEKEDIEKLEINYELKITFEQFSLEIYSMDHPTNKNISLVICSKDSFDDVSYLKMLINIVLVK